MTLKSSPETTLSEKLLEELNLAEFKAWDSLSRYKFQMFGYWAAIWVHLNRISGAKRPNPWSALVTHARELNKSAEQLLHAIFDADAEIYGQGPRSSNVEAEQSSPKGPELDSLRFSDLRSDFEFDKQREIEKQDGD